MNKTKLFLLTLGSVVGFSAVVQITASNLLSTDGIDLAYIKTQINVIQKENLELREKIYIQASLTEVASEAATLGFVTANDTVFLSVPQPIAIKP